MLQFIIGAVLALIVSGVIQGAINMFNTPSQFGNPSVGVWLLAEAVMIAVLFGGIVATIAIGTASAFYLLAGWVCVRVVAALLSFGSVSLR